MSVVERSATSKSGYLTASGYLVVVLVVWSLWSVRDQRLIIASEGLGYWLGIGGATLMLLLLLYPLRKRSRWLRNAGAIRHWFQAHMILGIVGPVFILLHSNFNLGSLNSKVALFCTIVVSTSGIIGRYLYAKIHNGMYGQRVTFDSIQRQMSEVQDSGSSIATLLPMLNKRLNALDSQMDKARQGTIASIQHAIFLTFRLSVTKRLLRRQIRSHLKQLSKKSAVVTENRKRLQRSAYGYLEFRLSVLRKFAQLQAAERLFSLWHIVHYPLFIILVVAAVVHIVAVHMY